MRKDAIRRMLMWLVVLSLLALPVWMACGQKATPTPTTAPKPAPTTAASPAPKPAPAVKPSPSPKPSPAVAAKPAPPKVKTVTIGYIAGFTGPLAEGTKDAFDAVKALYAWSNETNYIPGLKIELASADDQYDMSKVMAGYRTIKAKNPLVIQSYPAGNADVLKETLARDLIPMVNYGGGTFSVDPPGWVFVVVAMYDTQQLAVLKWINQNWDRAKMGRKARFAHVGWDNSMGTTAIKPGKIFASQLPNVEYVAAEVAPPGTMDFSAYVTRLKAADPDYIYLAVVAGPGASLVKTAIGMGIDKTKFMYFDYSAFQWDSVLRVLGKEGVEGSYAGTSFYHYTIDTPGMKQMWDIWDKYAKRPRPINTAVEIGYNPSLVTLEAIKRAVAKVGIDRLDGVEVYRALQTITNFAPGTMLPVTFGEERRDGSRHQLIYRIKDGQFNLVTPLNQPIDGGTPHPKDLLAQEKK